MKTSEKIRKRDDRLLKNEKSWRRAKVGVVTLMLFSLFVSYMIFQTGEAQENKELLFSCIGGVLFWIVIFEWLNLRISHIESIKYYRNQKERLCQQLRMQDKQIKEWSPE
jgi:hypothetical protein